MPAELRKRKEAPPAPVRAAKKKAPGKGKKPESEKTVVEKIQEAVEETVEAVKDAVVGGTTNGESTKPPAATDGSAKVGNTIDLTSFGGEIETNDGNKTTLAKLVEESKGGVVLFTYPKASTPGCKRPCPLSLPPPRRTFEVNDTRLGLFKALAAPSAVNAVPFDRASNSAVQPTLY